MQSQFPKDSQVCSSKCAAPTELFYYQNPGAEMEQAQSVTGQPYSKLPNAFRHRKEVVQGCSCKVADYQPELLGIKGQRRADPAGAQPAGTPGLAATAATPAAAPVATGAVPKRPQARAAAPAVPAAADQDLIAQTIERTRQAQPAQQVPGVTPPPAAPVPRLRPPERPVPAQQ